MFLCFVFLPWVIQIAQSAAKISPVQQKAPLFPMVVFPGEQAHFASDQSLQILLTPEYDNDNLTSIQVLVRFTPGADLLASQGLLFSASETASIPALDIKSDTLHVSDLKGDIQVKPMETIESWTVGQYWVPDRQPEGLVEVTYTALPRHVDNMTLSGPALDFRLESLGFTASAFAVLMVPGNIKVVYLVGFEWDMKNAPVGTRAVWSFGEHHHAVTRKMTPWEVLSTYLAAGKRLNAFQDESKMDVANTGFNVYWFDEPPFAAKEASNMLWKMFQAMSTFFLDDQNTYRVFLRHNPHAGTNTGTALSRSFIMGYDDTDFANPPTVLEKVNILAHEMVHNWILWDDTVNMTTENWYPEGMAEYYSILFLYRLGIIPAERYIVEINNKLSSYYTSPYVNTRIADAAKHTWESTSAQRLPYRRGFVLALVLDGLIYDASNGTFTLDNVILELIQLKKRGQPTGPRQFINSTGRFLGDYLLAEQLYTAVTEGLSVLLPQTKALRDGRFKLQVSLVRQDQEQFQLGFSEQAARSNDHTIRNLVPGSRAELAGLVEGDHVVGQFQASSAEGDFDKSLTLRIESFRDHQMRQVQFWPHAWEKTQSWYYRWDLGNEEL